MTTSIPAPGRSTRSAAPSHRSTTDVYDTNLLKRIATQTQSPVWTARATRFDRYLTAPPGLSAAAQETGQDGGPDLDLGVEDLARQRDDRRLDLLDDVLTRLAHVLLVGAGRASGRYSVRVSATDLAGNKASMAFPLIVRK